MSWFSIDLFLGTYVVTLVCVVKAKISFNGDTVWYDQKIQLILIIIIFVEVMALWMLNPIEGWIGCSWKS